MIRQRKQARSKLGPIGHIDALASMLSISTPDLLSITDSVDEFWIPGKTLRKKSGEPRPTSNARKPLKDLHEKIKNRLLKTVEYPYYLLGGISDSMTPRDYKRHATIHSGKYVLISEDVRDFFPSTHFQVVHSMWKRLFNIHSEVATVLTSLTSYKNTLPQGWKTSGYLANLVFWDLEPFLVEMLERRGFVYSRFMDDITVSSRQRMNAAEKSFVVSEIYKMLSLRGYRPNRKKHRIASSNSRMEVTGLNVNRNNPSLPKKERNNIRALVHQCENHYEHDRTSKHYKVVWNRISGKVGMLTRFHMAEGGRLRQRLREVKPL